MITLSGENENSVQNFRQNLPLVRPVHGKENYIKRILWK